MRTLPSPVWMCSAQQKMQGRHSHVCNTSNRRCQETPSAQPAILKLLAHCRAHQCGTDDQKLVSADATQSKIQPKGRVPSTCWAQATLHQCCSTHMPCSRSSKLHNKTCHKCSVWTQQACCVAPNWPGSTCAGAHSNVLHTHTNHPRVLIHSLFNISFTMNVWPLHIIVDISPGECTGRMHVHAPSSAVIAPHARASPQMCDNNLPQKASPQKSRRPTDNDFANHTDATPCSVSAALCYTAK